MPIKRSILIICMSILICSGCGTNEESNNKGSNRPSQAVIPDFKIISDEIEKVIITLGDGSITLETTRQEHIKKLVEYLNNSKQYDKPVVADLFREISVQKKDGSIVNLSISGNGTVFIEKVTKITYKINSSDKPFPIWIEAIETD